MRNSPEKPYMVEFNTMEEWNWFKTQAVSVGIPNNQHYWIGLVRPHKYENDWGTDYDAGWEWYKSKVPLSGNGGGSSSSSPTLETTLLAGFSYTYTVTYTITQSDLETGGVSNSLFVSGQDPFSAVVSDVSDDNAPIDAVRAQSLRP